MNVLEKILEEIKAIGGIRFSRYTELLIAVQDVEKIIRSHISDATDANNGWIPVEERLPEANEIVMVTVHSSEWVSDFDTSFVPEEEKKFHPERYDVFVGCLRENREWIFFDESMSETSCEKEFGNDKGYIYSVVSAWCPFPDPYKPK